MRVPNKTIIYLSAAFLLTIAIFVTPLIVFSGSLGFLDILNELITPAQRISTTISFSDANSLAYDVESVHVNQYGVTLSRPDRTSEVMMLNQVRLQKEAKIVNFTEEADTPPDTSITYQVSVNSRNWLYFDGSNWTAAGTCKTCANTALELDEHLDELKLENDDLRLRVFLSGQGNWSPTLKSVEVTSTGHGVYLPADQSYASDPILALASDSGSGKSGGSGSSSNDCECKGKATTLTLRYNGTEAAAVRVQQKKPETDVFNDIVEPAGEFVINGADDKGTLSTEIYIYINEVLDVAIHTSCSQPLEIDMTFGSFTLIDGASKDNGPFCREETCDNQPPAAADDSATTPVDTPVTISVLDNDIDPDGSLDVSSLSLVLSSGPSNGTVDLDTTTGEATYTPNPGFIGTDSFIYRICDNGGSCPDDSSDESSGGSGSTSEPTECQASDCPPLCDTATVTINVVTDDWQGADLDVSVVCYNDEKARFTIINNGPDPEGDMQSPTEYRIYRDGVLEETGTVQLDAGQDERIDHPAGYYSIISIEVDQVPGHPTGLPAEAEITECGDCTCEGQVVSLTLRYNGSEGAEITVDSKNGELFSGFVEPDELFSFVGLGNDEKMGSSIDVYIDGTKDTAIHTSCSQTIEIGMTFGSFTIMDGASAYNGRLCGSAGNRPPVAVDDVATTAPSTPVTIPLLPNDSDPDGDNIELIELITVIGPLNGTVTPNLAAGTATYTPNDGFFGTDYFEYRICDDGIPSLCDTAKVTVTIEGWDGSDIEASGACYDNKEARFTISNVGALNIGDMAGPVEYRIYRNDILEATGTVQLDAGYSETVSHPAGYYDIIRIEVDQRPGHPNGVPAEASVANCGDCTCRGGVTTLTLKYFGEEAVTVVVDTKDGEVFNDTVQPGGQFSFVGLGNNETLGSEIDIYIDGELAVTIHTSCSETIEIGMIYDPFEILYGESRYNGRLCGEPLEENDPPIAEDDYVSLGVSTDEDPTSIDILVLDNDYDPNGHPIRLDDILVEPFHGTLSVDYTTGVVTYTPEIGYTGTDSFEYQIFDIPGGGLTALSDTATVYITVSPVAIDDEAWTSIATPIEIHVLANDYDIDGVLVPDTVTYIDGSLSPAGGAVTVNLTTGTMTYTPPAGFVGDVTFDYTVEDDDGNLAEAEVLVHVVGGPPPVSCSITALDDYAVTTPQTAVDITILTNDTTGGNCTKQTSSLTLISQANPDAVIELDKVTGLATYTPPPGINQDEFVYQICTIPNPGQYCDIATVFITIRSGGGPLPPVAVNDEETTQINTPVTIDVLDNDFDWDNDLDPDSLVLLSGAGNEPEHGEAVIDSATNMVIYTPDDGFVGVDTFRYEVYDLTRLSDTATVTVTITPGGNLIPPIAADDSATTPYETPVTVPVLGNDFDPDGILINSTLLMLNPPSFGSVSTSTLTGTFTYTPVSGYIGFDSFDYQICDNDGLCDTARVSINVLPPFIPPPILPPAIPPIVIPAPIVPVAPDIMALNCPAPLTNTNTVTITGSYTGDIDDVIGIEYSVTDGLSWRPISNITETAAGADFNFTLNDLQSGEYRVRARAVRTIDGFTSSVSSESCPLTVDLGLIFGANQFILGAQPSPMADQGTIHFIVDQRHRFYLESRGASEAYLRVLETDEIFPLVWDTELKLWTGELTFEDPGFYRIEGTIANSLRAYTREINSILVTQGTDIVDADTSETVEGMVVTVYERTPDVESFKLWNAQAYAQSNPDRVSGGFAFVVPPGEFYVTVEHPDYDKMTSLITTVPEQSVISANISLETVAGVFGRLGRLITQSGTTNNFALTVRPAPPTELLPDNEPVPDISFTTDEGETTTLYEELADTEEPTVLFVYSTWNTNAQMQIDIYRRLAETYGDRINIIPVGTMEPLQLKSSQISRGTYDFDFLQPDDQFYEDYYIISLPAFYALDNDGVLLSKLFGPRSEANITSWFERTFDL